jgi:hypothetical protein
MDRSLLNLGNPASSAAQNIKHYVKLVLPDNFIVIFSTKFPDERACLNCSKISSKDGGINFFL